MKNGCSVFIDESGDQGINKVRTSTNGGQSPYLILGAALVNCEEYEAVAKRVDEIGKLIQGNKSKPGIHLTDLKHEQRIFVCRELAKLPVSLFGVISRKKTLRDYSCAINQDPVKFYNKTVQYLFELIGKHFEKTGIGLNDHEIIFEKIANFPYRRMINFISRVRENPMHEQSKHLLHIAPTAIRSETKPEQPLLAIADCTAYSIHRAVQHHKLGEDIFEPRYLTELCPAFTCGDEGIIESHGIKFIHSIEDCCPRQMVDYFRRLDTFTTRPY